MGAKKTEKNAKFPARIVDAIVGQQFGYQTTFSTSLA